MPKESLIGRPSIDGGCHGAGNYPRLNLVLPPELVRACVVLQESDRGISYQQIVGLVALDIPAKVTVLDMLRHLWRDQAQGVDDRAVAIGIPQNPDLGSPYGGAGWRMSVEPVGGRP